ncbi:hypothetical protein OG859_18595 [Streptomyces sp. NBC_00048]|uniref:hypothetical protein n=1 Tax=Streptomyces sp. NBC_00048 TaxID=2975628 RepID=UPI003251D6C3
MAASSWLALATAGTGVVGTLGGAYLGGWLTNSRERSQWSREQDQRGREQREARYGDFLSLAEELRGLLERFWEAPGPVPDELSTELNAKLGDLRKQVGRIQVTESDALCHIAYDVLSSAAAAHDIAIDAHAAPAPSIITTNAFQGALRDLRQVCTEFRERARSALGTAP